MNILSFIVYYNGEINRIYFNMGQKNSFPMKVSTIEFLNRLSNEPILEISNETTNILKLSINSLESNNNLIDLSKLTLNSIITLN
ncbi:hypothetical protein DDB_G0280023 [Dictyostelium discoideum AX4]|uniref:Putative uncharacterized protein DDB_G0280023 n=1 Tax=Dictyostelium discoideum TaxID=44689 RepID=Y8213_DICDI|nr:hypothetical protein DDB_G0280023 [Dictyostelium discoideum AX4]Q54W04.2 RecName: Full=Putative uncharacterized protein DDB_G0280023 [Dictyostelium discoideum]EAL67483.2 hypothetical protein DDB_G0280023 [Dictyostelium discoideum AX4]|eukprot:XP_641446.2 hypothetical protein DDB_G0280023 [Dictyostelium discoideum AX4]